jgi:hypothetical protein
MSGSLIGLAAGCGASHAGSPTTHLASLKVAANIAASDERFTSTNSTTVVQTVQAGLLFDLQHTCKSAGSSARQTLSLRTAGPLVVGCGDILC